MSKERKLAEAVKILKMYAKTHQTRENSSNFIRKVYFFISFFIFHFCLEISQTTHIFFNGFAESWTEDTREVVAINGYYCGPENLENLKTSEKSRKINRFLHNVFRTPSTAAHEPLRSSQTFGGP